MGNAVHTADAIIIGGGLHGCSTALHLALRGLSPLIVERDHVGRHASGVNAGGVRRLGRALPEIPLAEAALERWRNIRGLVDDGCGFVSPGQIKVAESETELQALTARRKTVLEAGFEHEEIIDRAQLRDLLPAISPHCVGGMLVRGDGYADPFRTALAFKRKAITLGARILENTSVIDIKRIDDNWRVVSNAGDLESPILVNCAGAWGGRVAAMIGERVPVEARALMLMTTARMPRFIEPVVGAQGRTLSFKQVENGTVMIGGGFQGRAEPEHNRTHMNFMGLGANAKMAAALFPFMRHARMVRCWAGIEGHTPDGIPVIGASAADGAFHAFGFSAHGFALTPIVGQIVADLIVTGTTDLPIAAFSVNRF